jgi:glycosyltransferase involved in cell wall biosynthesis
LVLYATPPITFANTIGYIKKRDRAITYLLLKDIFPQNAADLNMIKKGGVIYNYFRYLEKKMYKVSDYIGCLSPANVDYLVKHNPEINPITVEENPNSIELTGVEINEASRLKVRAQYGIPEDSIVCIYGGNLGKPQGIDFVLQVLDAHKEVKNLFIIVIGSGTEFPKIKKWEEKSKPKNILVMDGLPKNEYDELILACDIGLIFLDNRFTIPNFPSRLLSYLENKMPVLAATDVNTDIGEIIQKANCGFWVESGDLDGFIKKLKTFIDNPTLIGEMGNNGYRLLQEKYTVDISYHKLMNKLKIGPVKT